MEDFKCAFFAHARVKDYDHFYCDGFFIYKKPVKAKYWRSYGVMKIIVNKLEERGKNGRT